MSTRYPLSHSRVGATILAVTKAAGNPNAPAARQMLRFLRQHPYQWYEPAELGAEVTLPPEKALAHLQALLVAEMIERHPSGHHYRWRALPN